MTNTIIKKVTLTGATTTAEIDLGSYALVGVHLPELTSTSFTIQTTTEPGGTYRTVKDPLGLYVTAGNATTFTITATSAGYFPVPEDVCRGLRFIKLVFASSETADINLALKELNAV